jgi:hemolysin activation/secretion protein
MSRRRGHLSAFEPRPRLPAGAVALAFLALTAAGGAAAGREPAQTCVSGEPGCEFDVLDFAITGNTLLSEDEIGEALDPYLGERKTKDDLSEARSALDALYHKHGYQTVGVAMDQSPVAGIVRVTVVEQTVSRLRVVGAQYTEIDKIKAEAPSVAEGKVPDFTALADDLKTLNQPHREVTPEVKQGREPDTVEVDLQVKDEFPVQASLELNNRQSVNTTPMRLQAYVSYDNLFQEGHSLALNYTVAPQDVANSEVESFTYTAPLGQGDFQLQINGLNSSSNIAALSNTDVLGKGYQVGAHVIWRAPTAGTFASTLNIGFDYKNFDENVITSAVSSPAPVQYVPISVAYQASYEEPVATMHGSVSMLYNLSAASSSQVDFDNKRAYARSNFTIFRGEVDREQKFLGDYSVYGALEGQFADGPLINTESFSLGGYDSVRGYYESEAIADDGVRAAIELRSLNLATLFDKNPEIVNEAKMVVFYNGALGWVRQPLVDTKGAYALQSVGVGARMSVFKHVFGAFDVAWALDRGVQTKAGDARALFRLWTSFP